MAPHRLVCIVLRLLNHILVNFAVYSESAVVIETASSLMLWLQSGGANTHNCSVMVVLLLQAFSDNVCVACCSSVASKQNICSISIISDTQCFHETAMLPSLVNTAIDGDKAEDEHHKSMRFWVVIWPVMIYLDLS